MSLALVAWSGLTSCGPETAPVVPPPPPPEEVATVTGVARLTPEQVSATFVTALGLDYGISDGNDKFFSYVTSSLAVPLGGVDFNARVRDRDPLTKVQTLLVSRGVSWPLAIRLIERELAAPPDPLFTKCSFTEDYPSKDEASRQRYEAQLQEFYQRLFSRNATPTEIALHTETFERVYAREGVTSAAWLVTLYALLSSLETWHTWR